MNIHSPSVSTIFQRIKSEPADDTTSRLRNDLIEQKEEYEQKISQLQKSHDEQLLKLCSEIENSSALIHQYKVQVDIMRISLCMQEKELKTRTPSSSGDLQTKNTELTTENLKLKTELADLGAKYQILCSEIQDARQYLLKMIASLD